MIIRGKDFLYTGTIPLGVRRSDYTVEEDGVPLANRDASTEEISRLGAGRWNYAQCAFGNMVNMSSSDNSNPLTNGRHYRLVRKPS